MEDEKVFTIIETTLLQFANNEANLTSLACREKIAGVICNNLKSHFIFVGNEQFAKLVELKEYMKKQVEALDDQIM